jgi:hypothetical protein
MDISQHNRFTGACEQNIVAPLRTGCGAFQKVRVATRLKNMQVKQVAWGIYGYLINQRRRARKVFALTADSAPVL